MREGKIKFMVPGIFMGMLFLLAVFVPGGMKAYAAEIPQIGNLQITGSGEGICAQVDFEGYGLMSDCEIWVFLYRIFEDGSSQLVQSAVLAGTEDGTGTGSIASGSAEDGIYYAAAAVLQGSGSSVSRLRYMESAKMRVKREKDGYVVEPVEEAPKEPAGERHERVLEAEEGEPEASALECSHSLEACIVRAADPQNDAVAAEQCIYCGSVFRYYEIPNSAYAAFQEDAVQRILEGEQNGCVEIHTDRWVSFRREVLEALETRSDLTLKIVYRYQGAFYQVTVPGGINPEQLVNEEGYCGFRYLDLLFDGGEVTG